MFAPLISTGLLEGVDSGWGCLPSSFSVTEVWSDGGANDLNSIVTDQGGTTQIVSFDMTQDGTKLILGSAATGKIYTYTLSTPFDFSTGTKTSDRNYPSGGGCVRWYGSGSYIVFDASGTTDTVERYTGSGYSVSDSDTLHSDIVDTEVGTSPTSGDGYVTFNWSKSALYWWIEESGNQSHLTRTPVTNGNLGNYGTTVSVDFDPPFAAMNVQSGTVISPDEKTIYTMYGSVLYIGTMTTAGDITTLTWNTTNTLDLTSSTYGTPGSIWASQDGQTMYVNGSVYGTPKMMKLVCSA